MCARKCKLAASKIKRKRCQDVLYFREYLMSFNVLIDYVSVFIYNIYIFCHHQHYPTAAPSTCTDMCNKSHLYLIVFAPVTIQSVCVHNSIQNKKNCI